MNIRNLNNIKNYKNVYIFNSFKRSITVYKYLKQTKFANYITGIAVEQEVYKNLSQKILTKYNVISIECFSTLNNSLIVCDEIFEVILDKSSINIDYLVLNIDDPELPFTKYSIWDKYCISIHATDSCNLKCKGCDHFSSLVKNPAMKSVEDFKRDIQLLKKVLKPEDIGDISILGGEPLLNPRIDEFVKIIGEEFPNNYKDLLTNGLLLNKMPKSFFDNLYKYNVTLYITKYPVGHNYESIENSLRDGNILKSMVHYTDMKSESYNISLGKDPSDIYKNYRKCYSNCTILNNKRLYRCAPSAFYNYFNEYFDEHLDENVENGILLENANRYDVLEALSEPCSFCKYCKPNSCTEYSLSKFDIHEWTVPEF